MSSSSTLGGFFSALKASMMLACEFSAIDFDDVIAGAGVLAILPIDFDDVIVSAVDFGEKTLRGSGVGEGVGEGVVVGA